MQKILFMTLTLFVYALFFTACETTNTQNSSFEILKSPLAKERVPLVSQLQLQSLIHANNDFTLDIDKELSAPTKNTLYSAYSLFYLLNILSAGAEGQTKSQILKILHLKTESHQALNALNTKMTKTSNDFQIKSVNTLWLQKGFQVKEPFLDVLATQYGAGISLLDFYHDSKKSTRIINDWVAKETDQTITQLLPENALNSQTKLVLTNALYLKGDWVHKFPQQRTLYKNFTLLDNIQIQVQTMHQENSFLYTQIHDTKILSMPYQHSDYALLTIMPPITEFEDFKPQYISIMIDALKPTKLNLYYPRFSFSTTNQLISPLKHLGMIDAFSENADFSRINEQSLYISNIIQQAHIIVDENGTQAAAATAISVGVTSIPSDPYLEVKFDHPFLFALYHVPTQTILFFGRVLNPS